MQKRSHFREEGLDDLTTSIYHDLQNYNFSPPLIKKEDSNDKKRKFEEPLKENEQKGNSKKSGTWYSKLAKTPRPMVKSSATAPPGIFTTIPRVALIVFLIAIVVPGLRNRGDSEVNMNGADAGVIREAELVENASAIEGRANSPTSICTRWANQIANVNGTVYIYGGQATTQSGQTENTWNNDFLTLDLTKSWQIASPSLTGLPQPSGPPAVAMGSLWHSYTSLFLYGGLFSDSPPTSPLPVATWEYDISSSTWTEWSNPQTSAGNNSDGGNQPVQRAAEGAGISVPELGKSWYFGGHQDLYTTEGWSNQIARIYLKSLLEFTHPGYANSGVDSLGTTTAAPNGGVYRNITQGGIQDSAGFTERADGVLVYVPGWGEQGIILGLAGGTNETFTEMNIIDIYDVANSTWYKQATSGPSPPIRVDPCATVAMAPDGTSFNVYLYGGQNLIPYGSQIQYSDMWILTIPSFTWVQVNMDGQSQPPARAGHSCVMWDGQMVVIGGYVGTDISCDSPGIYVFNASSLEWTTGFTALSSSSSDSTSTNDPDSTIIQGSLGYLVPGPVQSIIGGSSDGGATATQPAAGSATSGPLATGKPPTFTITQSGSTIVQTAHSTSTATSPASTSNSTPAKAGTNVGAIVAGTIAGLLAIIAGYLAFCSWLYRKQLKLYKNHVAMAQRTAFAGSPENWGGESGNSSGIREKVGTGVMLGPFGTEVSGSGSAGRPSASESAEGSMHSGLAPVYSGAGVGGVGNRYSRVSEGDENLAYMGAGGSQHGEGARSTAGSSMEDLLGGQEPSFFSVVLNPRRTLRVVNLD
ncbi:uncharacterized protein LY89DRAFT_579414 [Mollisia scopiformis]|uniref:Kelch repeat-containing protein n=1 Tax=Mollisia scopiformis TaxID=149040 RepID=A0A194XJG0_MOLSC|nr:uncharacterized protein LY89DRAFT_579414 [Mollisia scopiformis]KUJ20293.1 hypothetical protein LY89DRAFT_579414 [Mollisia scopiformis]